MIPLAFRPLPSPGLAALPAAACRRARALAAVVAAAAGGSRPRNQKRKLAAAAEPASIHLVWDLDNMRPGRGLKAAGVPRVISGLLPALRQLLAEEGGPAAAAADSTNATQVTAYANKDSLQDLGGAAAVEDALARVGGRLVVAPYGPDAADRLMQADMRRLAEESSGRAVLVCISADHGFAPALRYAAGRGCTTVAVTKAKEKTKLVEAAGRGLVWDSACQSARQLKK